MQNRGDAHDTWDADANIFFALGWASEIKRSLESAKINVRLYYWLLRLDAVVKTALREIDDGSEFDPREEGARECATMFSQLSSRLEAIFEIADQRGASRHPFYKGRFDSIRPNADRFAAIVESWELSLNPKFGQLIEGARSQLRPSGKDRRDWRSSLANMHR
jgi:hypothetical protein